MYVDKWIQFSQREMIMRYLTPKSKVYILFILSDSFSVSYSDLKIPEVETAAFSIILHGFVVLKAAIKSFLKR